MRRKTMNRRSALGMIARAGAAAGAGSCFFLSLRTSPLAGQVRRPGRVKYEPENVVVSGAGPTILVKISGPPGRHYAVVYATTDGREHYKLVDGSRGRIAESGLGTVTIAAKRLPDAKVFLRVVTGSTDAFDDDYAGTEPFVAHISGGALSRFDGVKSRPLVDAKGVAVAAASFAAACASVKRR